MKMSMIPVVAAAGLAISLAEVSLAQGLDLRRAEAAELLADAAGRTNSLAQETREFTVNLHGYSQFRYNINHRDDEGLDEDLTIGFSAKTKINLSGNIASENWGYYIQFKFEDSGGGAAVLDDAYATYKSGNGWKWTFGQFKLPLYREENMSDTGQLFANRSVNNSVFTQSRSQGIQAAFESDNIQFFGAFSDGLGTRNTDFDSASEADWALTGRVNYKWAGAWKQGRDFTSFQNSDFFGMVGVAGHFQDGGETFATADTQRWDLTADVQVEGNGWNVFAAGMARNIDPASGDDFLDYGFIVQGGVFVAPQWELIAGYDLILPDDDRPTDENFSTIRVGANYYLIPDSHSLKLTVDFSYFLDTQSESIAPANTQTGLLASGEDSQWNLRAQLQWVF